jgi:hypothetical protein
MNLLREREDDNLGTGRPLYLAKTTKEKQEDTSPAGNHRSETHKGKATFKKNKADGGRRLKVYSTRDKRTGK